MAIMNASLIAFVRLLQYFLFLVSRFTQHLLLYFTEIVRIFCSADTRHTLYCACRSSLNFNLVCALNVSGARWRYYIFIQLNMAQNCSEIVKHATWPSFGVENSAHFSKTNIVKTIFVCMSRSLPSICTCI